VGIGAAKNPAVKHPRDDEIADELGFAGDFLDAVDARHAMPDIF
jgi:hypothetical protein